MAPGGGRKRASKREKASATRGDVVQEAEQAGSGSQKKKNALSMVAEAGPRVRLRGSGQGVEGMAAVEATSKVASHQTACITIFLRRKKRAGTSPFERNGCERANFSVIYFTFFYRSCLEH